MLSHFLHFFSLYLLSLVFSKHLNIFLGRQVPRSSYMLCLFLCNSRIIWWGAENVWQVLWYQSRHNKRVHYWRTPAWRYLRCIDKTWRRKSRSLCCAGRHSVTLWTNRFSTWGSNSSASSVCKVPEVPYTVCEGGRDGGTIVCVVCWDCWLGDCESENGWDGGLGDSETEEGYKLEDSESLVEESYSCKEEGISLCFVTASGLDG